MVDAPCRCRHAQCAFCKFLSTNTFNGRNRHFRRTLVLLPRSIDMTPHILIVEDDPLIAMDLEAIALEAGAVPLCAATVREALTLAECATFALALLDIDVRDGNTFPVARILMQRRVPVIFVSAVRPVDIPDDVSTAPLLPKPYRPAELRAVIQSHA
jgi:DNA-binding response OmpR family regulator